MQDQNIVSGNTSGQGANAVVPEEIKGWNWAAFLMNGFWAIGHKTWIGLISFVPYAGFIMAIILGIKGSEWAWQNRQFESVEQFKKVQKIWTYWGIGLFVVSIIVGLISGILGGMMAARQGTMGQY
ncbi:MAG: hypothetical protein ACYC27_10445 [Armatimonadota bacterium]